ncbi:replication initiator protein A [Staphylococcus epidermidis]
MTKQRFTKLYKFLFEDSTFNKLSIKAKLLYALITERQNLSKLSAKQHGIQSQFIDANGRLFSIYTNKELMNKINISEPTVINLKKQLIAFGLLEEIRLGKNKPNRLYPKNLMMNISMFMMLMNFIGYHIHYFLILNIRILKLRQLSLTLFT